MNVQVREARKRINEEIIKNILIRKAEGIEALR